MLDTQFLYLVLLIPLVALFLWIIRGWPFDHTDIIFGVGGYCDLEAESRAQEMLRELLTDEEYRRLNAEGYLVIASKINPGQQYHVPRFRGQVRVYEDKKLVAGLCLQPREALPDADLVIMHKVMLEGDEEAYLAEANHFIPRRNGRWRLQL